MANEQLASIQAKQEMELSAYLESIESAKWEMWINFKFVYQSDIEFHDFAILIDKVVGELK